MIKSSAKKLPWITAAIGLAALGWGWTGGGEPLVWAGAGAAAGVALILFTEPALVEISQWSVRRAAARAKGKSPAAAREPARPAPREPSEPGPGNVKSLVETLLTDGRYALLLRPQIAGNLDTELLTAAGEQLDRQMALVPDGEVLLESAVPGADLAPAAADEPRAQGLTLHVAPAFLDRYPVTNRQFQAFVDAGCYEQVAIWDQVVWPAVLDFVDATGQPGPRFWREGRFPPGREDHPVVGICWYEAAAYARWVGKRLPTDAEWVKAACWPVHLGPGSQIQRRYPWGNTMDRNRVNLWGCGPGDTVPVEEHVAGVSVGGVYQMIGNVWEWTADDFRFTGDMPDGRGTPMPLAVLKTLRGGAFDTYFDHQATAQFASGDSPLARRHNVGCRCALGICDLAGQSTVAFALSAAPAEELQDETAADGGDDSGAEAAVDATADSGANHGLPATANAANS